MCFILQYKPLIRNSLILICNNLRVFSGHDTTASAVSWCLYLLASHPEYQAKARQEIDDILQRRESDYIEW